MASTNKTTHYNLSQFVGSDKPAWLTDYNSDMGKIDTGINSAQTTATGADGKADTNATNIGTLANLTTDAKTSLVAAINEVDTAAETAQGTANDAYADATTAKSGVNALKDYLALGNETAITWTVSVGTVNTSYSNVKSVRNNTNSLGKIYGRCLVSGTAGTGTITFTSSDTGLRPSTDIVINGVCYDQVNETSGSNTDHTLVPMSITLKTDGTMVLTGNRVANGISHELLFFACVIFAEDFGDVIQS